MIDELAALLELAGKRGYIFDAFRVNGYGPDLDVFAPVRVYWVYAGSPVWTLRALLTLAPPGYPDAPGQLVGAPPGIGLPAEDRMPVRIRKRGP